MDVNSTNNDEDNSPTDVILAVQGLVGMGTLGFSKADAVPLDISTSTTATLTTMPTSLSSASSHVSSINDSATMHSFNPSSVGSYGIGSTSTSIFSKFPSGSMSTFTALRNSMRPHVRPSGEHLPLNNNGESDHEDESITGSRGSLARRRRLKEPPGGLLSSSVSSATNHFLSSAILYEDKESRHHNSNMTDRLSSSSSSSSAQHAYMGHPSYSADSYVVSAMGNDHNASSSGKSKISGISSRSGGTSGNDGNVSKASGTIGNDICEQLQPKLVLIFDTYCQHTQQPQINTSKPLLMLCLEHIVPFGCWVRETPNGCEWIREVLEDHVDLRPEVRNGLCMLVIYGLSAVRVRDLTRGKGSGQLGIGHPLDSEGNPVDIFTILACQHMGFGIVNKTSIRVYTDPLKRFAFLKLVLSGLIDAGRLPENERVGNQPKKCKKPELLHEELMRYEQMCALFRATYARGGHGLPPGQGSASGQGLVSLDDCGKMIEALVLQILTAWQMCGKSVRNQWFTVAVAAITSRSSHVNAVGEGERTGAGAGAGAGKGAAATSFGLQSLGGISATAKAGHGLVVGSGIALGGVQGLGQPVVPYPAQGLGLTAGQGLFPTYPPTSMWPGITLPGGDSPGASSSGAGGGVSRGGVGKDRSTVRKAHSAEGSASGGGRSRGAGGGGRSKSSASGSASTKTGGSASGRATASSKIKGAGSVPLPSLQEVDENASTLEDSGPQIWDAASGGATAVFAASLGLDDGAMVVNTDSDSERGVSPSSSHSVDEVASVGAESGEGSFSVERVRSKVSQCNLGKRRREAANVDEGHGQGQEKTLQVKMTAAASSSSSSLPGAGQSQARVRVMCFERVDTREWEIRDCRVAVTDVIALLDSMQGQQALYLVDEAHLSSNGVDNDALRGGFGETMTLTAKGLGLGVSLQSELKLRQAIVTAWSKALHTSFRDFLLEWMQQQRQHLTSSLSLLDFWHTYDQMHFRGGLNQPNANQYIAVGGSRSGLEPGLGSDGNDGVSPVELSLVSSPVQEDHAMMTLDDGCHDGSKPGGDGLGLVGGADVAARSLFDVVKMAKDMTRCIQPPSEGDKRDQPQFPSQDNSILAVAAAEVAAYQRHGRQHHHPQEQQAMANRSMLLNRGSGYGVIVYEVSVKIGFVLRANPALGLQQDTWRVFYLREVEKLVVLSCQTAAASSSSGSTASFGQLLGLLFPQLNRPRITQASHANANHTASAQGEIPETIVVTYYPHSKTSLLDGSITSLSQHPQQSHQQQQQPPSLLPSDAYQTVGTLAEPAMTMMERLDSSATVTWHDLILTVYN